MFRAPFCLPFFSVFRVFGVLLAAVLVLSTSKGFFLSRLRFVSFCTHAFCSLLLSSFSATLACWPVAAAGGARSGPPRSPACSPVPPIACLSCLPSVWQLRVPCDGPGRGDVGLDFDRGVDDHDDRLVVHRRRLPLRARLWVVLQQGTRGLRVSLSKERRSILLQKQRLRPHFNR